MMSKPAAIMGSLTDIRNVAATKSVVLRVEVPAERAQEVLDAFGWPTGVNPIAVAIARLDPAKGAAEPIKADDKPKRAWGDLAPAQQCGIRCNEPAFRRFLAERFHVGKDLDVEEAANAVRMQCGVNSRKEMFPGSPAAARWHQLDGDFEAWLRYGEMA